MMAERANLYKQKKEIEEKIKALDEDLRPMLVGRGAVVYDGFQFEVKSVAGRTSYDTKAMIADGLDLEPYKKVSAPSTRFDIKEVNEL